MKQDITQLVERLEAFEERVGVSLDAIYANVAGPDDDGDFAIELNGELHSANAGALADNVTVALAIYDAQGRVIATNSYFILAEEFFGFETFSLSVYAPLMPSKIRLYPHL